MRADILATSTGAAYIRWLLEETRVQVQILEAVV